MRLVLDSLAILAVSSGAFFSWPARSACCAFPTRSAACTH